MKQLIIFLILALTLSVGHGLARGESPAYLQAKNGLVLVETGDNLGSGFAVARNLVATACHLIKGAAGIRLHFWAAKAEVAGKQRLCDEKQDIAYISTTVPEGTAILEFAPEKPTQGEQIWVWGYPLGRAIALEPSVSAGIVSATDTALGFIALDVSGAPGNSGGPVVNAQGKVIGIFVATWVAGRQGATGFKYAVPSTIAASLMTPGLAPAAETNVVQPASAVTIRPGESIGALKLGMTLPQAQEAIGLPPTDRDGDFYIWSLRKLMVVFENGKIQIIGTEDPAEVTAEGIRIGATDTDLIKTYGAPLCSSIRPFRGKAYLTWYYEGLFVFLEGTPRRVSTILVMPKGTAREICS